MLDELRPYLPPGVSPSPETDDFELASASYYSVPSKLDRPVPPAVRDAWAETRGLASGVDPDLLFKKAVELETTVTYWPLEVRIHGPPSSSSDPKVSQVIHDGALLDHPTDEVNASLFDASTRLIRPSSRAPWAVGSAREERCAQR